MLALVNGGAAVAVLTYLGNLVVRSPPTAHLPNLKPALLWYCGGLLLTVFAFILAYLTQLRLFREANTARGGQQLWPLHGLGIAAGCCLALFAAVAFGLGCWRDAGAIDPGGDRRPRAPGTAQADRGFRPYAAPHLCPRLSARQSRQAGRIGGATRS
jgi:hypothetical protein